MKKQLLKINILAIIACVLWSTAFAGVKIGLEYSTPLRFAGLRFFMAGILLLPLALREGKYLKILKQHAGKIFVVSLLQIIIQYIFFYLGLSKVSGTLGAIFIGSSPLVVAIIAHFTLPDDRLNFKKLVIILLGFSGISLVAFGRNAGDDSSAIRFIGIIYLLIVIVSSGFVNIYIKKGTSGLPPLVMSSASMWFGGLVILLLSIPIEGLEVKVQPLPYYLSLGWLSFLSAAAFGIWLSLLKIPVVKVTELNFWKFLIPVLGAVLAWILLPDESPDALSVFGVLITGVSLVLMNLVRRRII